MLVVASAAATRRAMRRTLARAGWLVVAFGDPRAVGDALRGVEFDALVIHGDGDAARCARSLAGGTPVLLLDGGDDGAAAVPDRLAAHLRELATLN